MQKKGLMLAFISVFSVMIINLVSAQFYGGYSLSDILNSIDSSTLILGVIFVVSFGLINQALMRSVFRDNRGTGTIIALAVSLLIIYGINLTGLDFEGFFYTLGFSEGILYTILPLILIGGFIYLGIKLKSFGAVLAIFGGLLIVLSFTDFIYSKGTTMFIGILFLVVGFWLWHKKKDSVGSYRNHDAPSGPSSRQIYKQELAERKYAEKARQAQIRARAKNIQKIRRVREKRDRGRKLRRGET